MKPTLDPTRANAADAMILEELIDRHGPAAILESIAAIAREKAEHLRVNWQDDKAAKVWETKATKIERTANAIA